jgi:small subunit ribosomal protein S15
MARLHSRKKGKSGSTSPPTEVVPEWVELKPKEVKELIINLANAGHTAAEIGAILRDQYGIPKVKLLTKKKIVQILEENGLKEEIPRDLLNLIKRSVNQLNHLKANKKDFSAKRGYQLTVSKIRRLTKYYIREGKLPANWHYSPEKAALLVK